MVILYSTGLCSEISSLSKIFAQCPSSSVIERIDSRKVRTENQDQVMDGWSVTQLTIIFSSRI